jgi:cation transport regulator ChaB
MKYQRIDALPSIIKDYLSEQAQHQFLIAFNRYVETGSDHGSAIQLAWMSLQATEKVQAGSSAI